MSDTDVLHPPTDRLLTWSLVVAPLVYLAADSVYAAKGWDSADAGGLHVLGAAAYAFVMLKIITWTTGWLQCATLFAGIVGACGNVAYGFNTIHVSLGGIDLVDTSGPGALIKLLGLFGPLAFVLAGVVLARVGARVPAMLVGVAGLAWPVAHIANIAWLAIVVNVLLVAGFVPLAARPPSVPLAMGLQRLSTAPRVPRGRREAGDSRFGDHRPRS